MIKTTPTKPVLSLLFLLCLLFSTQAWSAIHGQILLPTAGSSETGNLTFFAQLEDAEGELQQYGLTVLGTDSKTLTLTENNAGETSLELLKTLKLDESEVGPFISGELTLQLWANAPSQVLDTITINWQSGLETLSFQSVERLSNNQLSASWSGDAAVYRYNVYLASESNLTPANVANRINGRAHRSLNSHTIELDDLNAEVDYWLLVTGVTATGEDRSTEVYFLPTPKTPPTLTLPESLILSAVDANGFAITHNDIQQFLQAATANDNIDGPVSVTHDAPSRFPLGITTVTFSAQDAAGNIRQQSRTVSVQDSLAPVINLPDNIILAATDANGTSANQQAISAFLNGATATDAVNGSVTVNHNAPETFPLGVTTITFTAQDLAFNSAQASATVTIKDLTPPIMTLVGDSQITLEVGETYQELGASAIDNVEGNLSNHVHIIGSVDTTTLGLYTLRYQVQDSSENTATVTRTISVQDAGAPIVTPPNNIRVAAIDGKGTPATQQSITTFLNAATAIDTVDGIIAVKHNAPETFPLGVTSVTFSAQDAALNTGQASATVTVEDLTPPNLSLIGDSTVTLEVGATYQEFGATAHDQVEGDLSSQITLTGSVDTTKVGHYTLSYQVQDRANNTASISRTIQVQDTTGPIITPPNNITVAATDASGTAATAPSIASFLTSSSAQDAADGDLTVSHNAPETFPLGVTSVTFSAQDAALNTGQASATVTVEDLTPPSLSLIGEGELILEAGEPYQEQGASALDNVDGNLSNQITITGTLDPMTLGTYTLNYQVQDRANNTQSIRRTITVRDTTPPIISPPDHLSIELLSGNQLTKTDDRIVAFLANASVQDTADPQISLQNDLPETVSLGPTTVTFHSEDASGNQTSATATLTLTSLDQDADGLPNTIEEHYSLDKNDSTDAQQDLDGDGVNNFQEYQNGTNLAEDDIAPTLLIPNAIQATATGLKTHINLGQATAEDGKDGPITPTHNAPDFFASGAHTVTWSVEDAAGNHTSQQQIIEIQPLINTKVSQKVAEGQTTKINFYLSGPPIEYPVTVEFSISGNIDQDDYTLDRQTVTINQGLQTSIPIEILQDQTSEIDEFLTITLDQVQNAAIGPQNTHTLTIEETEVVTGFDLVLTQNQTPVSHIDPKAGIVTIELAVDQTLSPQQLFFNWMVMEANLKPIEGWGQPSFSFDPNSLQADSLTFSLEIFGPDSNALYTYLERSVKLLHHPPELLDANDSDLDGLSDLTEGFQDNDRDFIADYLDSLTAHTLIPTDAKDQPLQVEEGVHIKLGNLAYLADYPLVHLTSGELETISHTYNQPYTLSHQPDMAFTAGLVDFELTKIEPGANVKIVIPLSTAVHNSDSYQLIVKNNGAQPFIEDNHNNIRSYIGKEGACPMPRHHLYSEGLQAGAFCLELTLQDGGPNDPNGIADGVIPHLGGLAHHASVNRSLVKVQNLNVRQPRFALNHGPQVVLAFSVDAQMPDMQLNSLTTQSSGDLDEVGDIQAVMLYHDQNQNGQPDASEWISSSVYRQDNGKVTFELTDPLQLTIGSNHFLVAYQ